nr:hypothetical protein [uncultured bacterium]
MDLRFNKGVRKVISVETDSDGTRTVTTMYRKRKPKKRSNYGSIERVVRSAGTSARTLGEDYIARHDKSNRNKTDGWFRDLPYNIYRATRKATKKLQLMPLPLPYMGADVDDDDDIEDEDDE